MDFYKYMQKIKLNQNDPDFLIEEFWIGFKVSMLRFYHSVGILDTPIKSWSDILNEYKKEKQYNLIEEKIKEFIGIYAIDVMKFEKLNENKDSLLLMTNIKRWNKISNKFHFEQSGINKKIIGLFEAYHHIKKRFNPEPEYILKLFKNIDQIFINKYDEEKSELKLGELGKELIIKSFSNGLIRILEIIESVIGHDLILDCIRNNFPEVSIKSSDKYTSWIKLYKRYQS